MFYIQTEIFHSYCNFTMIDNTYFNSILMTGALVCKVSSVSADKLINLLCKGRYTVQVLSLSTHVIRKLQNGQVIWFSCLKFFLIDKSKFRNISIFILQGQLYYYIIGQIIKKCSLLCSLLLDVEKKAFVY